MSIELMMLSNHLILCCLLLILPSIFPNIRVFFTRLALHIRWLNYWSFSFSPSNEYSGLTFFRIDWFDLPAVQGTLKSLLHARMLCVLFSLNSLSRARIVSVPLICSVTWAMVAMWLTMNMCGCGLMTSRTRWFSFFPR